MRLLDLFCGAGGAAMGYRNAGFTEIVGIDIEPQPNYPFEFIQADVMETLVYDQAWLAGFDLIHASPPCQAHSPIATGRWGKDSARWGDVLEDVQRRLFQIYDFIGPHYVIENVQGAKSVLIDPIRLTGEMFGLPVHRPRLFELGGWTMPQPKAPKRQKDAIAVYGKPDGRRLWNRKDGSILYAWSSVEQGKEALGVPWMTEELEVRESIPPAYTEYVGRHFLAHMWREQRAS